MYELSKGFFQSYLAELLHVGFCSVLLSEGIFYKHSHL